MFNFLSAIPFKKELLIVIAVVGVVFLYTVWVYNAGADSVKDQQTIDALKSEKEQLEKKLISNSVTVKVVTEYKEKIVEIDKKVPVYVKTVEEIFAYDDSIVVPDNLARLHDDIVCDANTTCGANNSKPGVVTLGQFSKAVVTNYSTCKANSIQLNSLIAWLSAQGQIYPQKPID